MKRKSETDVVLIGAGIMSATLGVMLKELQPDLTIRIFERLDMAAAESSDAWNNAGTGHSAFCELNYTPQLPDGSVDISKAVKIAESFEVSKQFWAYLVKRNYVESGDFIRNIAHMSFVWGEENVHFLRTRFETLQKCHLFQGMQYSEDPHTLQNWMPLVMEGRPGEDKLAATRMDIGTDVNFGSLTRALFNKLQDMPGVYMHFNQDVRNIDSDDDGKWLIKLKDITTKTRRKIRTRFVFIGAGGGSLPLLLKSGIPEAKGYGGFPVSGQWLKCLNPDIIERHDAKVYGKASVGAPPMSVPHLDTRMIDGKKALLFGPYAGFSTKFLKHGSLLDLPLSVKPSNIMPMLSAGFHNIPLTRYLIEQVRQSPEDRLNALKEYYPNAVMEDWELAIAGQRVQVIKKDEEEGGILEFGTEVVSSADGSIAALLGASPGASTAVAIMIGLIQRCFPTQATSNQWQTKFKEMVPSFGLSLATDKVLLRKVRAMTDEILALRAFESVLA